LPSLPELARTHGVSLVTARLALARLRQEGLVISRQGVGNFVRARPPVRRYGIGRYSRSVWASDNPQPILVAEGGRQGRAVDQATETATVPAPAFVAGRLPGIAEGDLVHVRRRLTTIDGIINQSADSYYTLATGERSPDLVAGRGAGGHIARINAISPVLEIQEEIAARMPTSPEAARLAIPEGTPSSRSSAPTTPQTARSMSPGLSSAPTWPSSTTGSPSQTEPHRNVTPRTTQR
jgi:GntR family transcriptional regulator